MSISRIELQGQITRAQDFTNIKHNEDQHSNVQQSVISRQSGKAAELKLHHVNDSEETQNYQKKFDAKEEGSNQYQGDGGGQRKKKRPPEDGRVVVKGPTHGFDLKI